MAEETEYACGARRVPLITCRTAIDFIPDYLSAGIAPSTTVPFQKHINGCADCAAILHTYRKTIELTRSFFHGPDPDFAPRPACNPAFSRRRIRSTHPLIVK
jgi:hypothetical protein